MAGQDYPKRLEAGATQNVNIAGDYIFCKFADRPFTVIMDGSRVTMEGGDKYRNSGGFKEFEIENTDKTRPIAIVLTIGQGDYNRQIVKGEVGIVPILRNADGTTKPDTRFDIEFMLNPSNLIIKQYDLGDLIGLTAGDFQGGSPMEKYLCIGPGGTLWNFSGANNANYLTVAWDIKTQEYLGVQNGYRLGFAPGTGIGVEYLPALGFVYFNQSGEVYLLTPTGGTGSATYTLETTLTEAGYSFRGLTFDPAQGVSYGYYTSASGAKLVTYGADFEKLLDVATSAGTQYASWSFDRETLRHVGWTGNGSTSTTWETFGYVDFQPMETATFSSPVLQETTTQGAVVIGKTLFFANGSNPVSIRAYAFEAYDTKPEFKAIKRGCEFVALFDHGRPPQITANFTAVKNEAGYVSLDGELVKAALEFYFLKKAPDDYLDHVYFIDAGLDEGQRTFKPVYTGNETFAAGAVADSFGISAPGNVRLTIDNELTMGEPL